MSARSMEYPKGVANLLKRMQQQAALWCFGLMLIVSLGCGGGLPTVPVSGVVTFDGGACPAPGNVIFKPVEIEEGLPSRPGRAQFGTDGRFEVTSFNEGDGLLPGTYIAEVSCDKGIPDFSSKTPWEDIALIAKEYEPETIVLERDASELVLTLDVPGKKTR